MKRKLTRIGLFYCMLSLFFTAQVGAQQCIQLFYEKASTKTNRLLFTNINAAINDIEVQLRSQYSELNSVESNIDRNQVLLNIVETNNDILQMFDHIITNRHLNSTKRSKDVQSGLLNHLFQLFKNQGLSVQLINAIVNSRIALINQLNNDAGKASGPIGFLQPMATETSEPLQRTIGFHRHQIEAGPYGRSRVEQVHRNPQTNSRNPIGFIHSNSDKSPAKTMKSIGFVQSEDAVDVAYQITLGFNFDISAFIGVSNQQAIGY